MAGKKSTIIRSKKDFCVIIPAIKKNAKIPDQLVKKLNGITLIQRSLNIAKRIIEQEHIYVVTDSQEISLICERNHVHYYYDDSLKLDSNQILKDLNFFFLKKSLEYNNIILYRASTPLVDENNINSALDQFTKEMADLLITLRKENHKIWKGYPDKPENLFIDTNGDDVFIELRAFIICKSDVFARNTSDLKIIPYLLNENGIEINSYQDWWLCEKLLNRKRILFVVAGYPEIGMGHIYRALTIAHEIHDHEIVFLCTRESELALKRIAEKEYKTILQKEDLATEVIKIRPNLVINDILNTEKEYISKIKNEGIKVVNFEDLGSGASYSDLTINELYDNPLIDGKNIVWGNNYLFLRDEFIEAKPHHETEKINSVLITFGGTDAPNLTQKTFKAILPYCRKKRLWINIVTGPGYIYKDSLMDMINKSGYDRIEFTAATNVISKVMENSDVAISSNGRTVYELAHMNIPSIIIAHHEREDNHQFAVKGNGFLNLGILREKADYEELVRAFITLVENHEIRSNLFVKLSKHSFLENKKKVLNNILNLLEN